MIVEHNILCVLVIKYKVEFYTVGAPEFRERLTRGFKLLRKTSWRDQET